MQAKHALITGATGGIGVAIAHTFVKEGWHVALSGTNNDKVETLKLQSASLQLWHAGFRTLLFFQTCALRCQMRASHSEVRLVAQNSLQRS
jgi:NAD(P)-dependent dehydrogenase (short-subunit alcohol dehydrogenase family)